MRRIFAGQDPAGHAYIARSVRLAGDSAGALTRVDDLRGSVDAALGALDERLSSGTGRSYTKSR